MFLTSWPRRAAALVHRIDMSKGKSCLLLFLLAICARILKMGLIDYGRIHALCARCTHQEYGGESIERIVWWSGTTQNLIKSVPKKKKRGPENRLPATLFPILFAHETPYTHTHTHTHTHTLSACKTSKQKSAAFQVFQELKKRGKGLLDGDDSLDLIGILTAGTHGASEPGATVPGVGMTRSTRIARTIRKTSQDLATAKDWWVLMSTWWCVEVDMYCHGSSYNIPWAPSLVVQVCWLLILRYFLLGWRTCALKYNKTNCLPHKVRKIRSALDVGVCAHVCGFCVCERVFVYMITCIYLPS